MALNRNTDRRRQHRGVQILTLGQAEPPMPAPMVCTIHRARRDHRRPGNLLRPAVGLGQEVTQGRNLTRRVSIRHHKPGTPQAHSPVHVRIHPQRGRVTTGALRGRVLQRPLHILLHHRTVSSGQVHPTRIHARPIKQAPLRAHGRLIRLTLTPCAHVQRPFRPRLHQQHRQTSPGQRPGEHHPLFHISPRGGSSPQQSRQLTVT